MSDSRFMKFVAGIFQRPSYVSEPEQFLQDLVRARPEIAADQRKARAMWWDHPQELETAQRYREAEVPQSAYVYYPAKD